MKYSMHGLKCDRVSS